jgi:hypothetical protein
MPTVYVVIENCDVYPVVYTSYASAVAAVKERHAEEIKEDEGAEDKRCDLDIEEDTETGKTQLYIEKGINILIHRLPVAQV